MTKNIPGIFNYCDRWCERCSFSDRCAVGIEELHSPARERDINSKAFWEEITNNFQKAIEMLNKAAKEHGIDISELTPDEEEAYKVKEETKKKRIKETVLIALSKKYMDLAHKWLQENEELREKGEELAAHLELGVRSEEQTKEVLIQIKECLEIIQWYLHFFYVKFQRAMSGKIESDNRDEDPGYQKDSDGSAKVAMIAVERTMGAWQKMFELGAVDEDTCLDLLSLLEQVKNASKQEFPDAMKFIRPGFDE